MKIKASKQRGFTLVELAIVLVIIGIILGAVIKGQDLIANARAKRLTSELRKWEVVLWTYYDRHHKFPILPSDDGNTNIKNKLGGLANQLHNPLDLGGKRYLFAFGYNGTQPIVIICPENPNNSGNCIDNPDEEDIFYFKSIDVSIDGSVNATDGLVLGIKDNLSGLNDWNAGSLSSFTEASDNYSDAKALVYFLGSLSFDDR